MIDHVSVPVRDLAAARDFYTALLAPLGLKLLVERPHTVGFGKAYPELWLNHRPALVPIADNGAHVALRARSEDIVRAFHAAALAAGGQSDGAPGPRQAAMTTYYGAFVLDLDLNKIEVMTFPATAD